MDVTTYSSAEVVSLAEVTYRQLDYWTRIGLVRPSVVDAVGSGSRRRWSEADLLRVRRVRLASKLCNGQLVDALDALDAIEAELAALAGAGDALRPLAAVI